MASTRSYDRVKLDDRSKLIHMVFYRNSFTIKQAASILNIKYDNAKKICRRYTVTKFRRQRKDQPSMHAIAELRNLS